jgi:hypothetical protein
MRLLRLGRRSKVMVLAMGVECGWSLRDGDDHGDFQVKCLR